MQCTLWTVQYVEKAETAFNIRLNYHRKNVSNPKSIPADLHFRKPGHSFHLHIKFTLIAQLSNIHNINKYSHVKIPIKTAWRPWIKKLEALTPKGLNQELNV